MIEFYIYFKNFLQEFHYIIITGTMQPKPLHN